MTDENKNVVENTTETKIETNNDIAELKAIVTAQAKSISALANEIKTSREHNVSQTQGIYEKVVPAKEAAESEAAKLRAELAKINDERSAEFKDNARGKIVNQMVKDGYPTHFAELQADNWLLKGTLEVSGKDIFAKDKDAAGNPVKVSYDDFYNKFNETDVAKLNKPVSSSTGAKTDVVETKVNVDAKELSFEDALKAAKTPEERRKLYETNRG